MYRPWLINKMVSHLWLRSDVINEFFICSVCNHFVMQQLIVYLKISQISTLKLCINMLIQNCCYCLLYNRKNYIR